MASAEAPPTLDLTQELRRLQELHGALDRRTRGMTWMVWGLVLPAVSLTYSYAGSAMQAGATFSMWWFLVLWIPWAAIGVIVTAAMWKTAGLMMNRSRAAWNGVKAFLILLGVTLGLYLGYHFLRLYEFVALVGPSVMLLLIGLGTLVLGLNRWACPDRVERILWAIGGLVLILVTIVGTLVVGPVPHDAEPSAFVPALRAFAVIAPVAITVVYVGNGLYLSSRG